MQKTDILSVFSLVHSCSLTLTLRFIQREQARGQGEGEYPREKVEDVVGLQS